MFTCITRYLDGSLAILENSTVSSLNLGRLDGSIIQPDNGETTWIFSVDLKSSAAAFSADAPSHIWPWSCRRRWCRWEAEAAALLSPAQRRYRVLGFRRTVCSRRSSAPTRSRLQTTEHPVKSDRRSLCAVLSSEQNVIMAHLSDQLLFNRLDAGLTHRSSTRHSDVCTSTGGSTPTPST